MRYLCATVTGLSLAALAVAPAQAGDDRKKTSDTQQLPQSGSSVTVDPKTDTTPSVGSGTQTQGSVTTDSPSASPATPSTPGATDSTVNPSSPSGAASPQTGTGETKEKPKY